MQVVRRVGVWPLEERVVLAEQRVHAVEVECSVGQAELQRVCQCEIQLE